MHSNAFHKGMPDSYANELMGAWPMDQVPMLGAQFVDPLVLDLQCCGLFL